MQMWETLYAWNYSSSDGDRSAMGVQPEFSVILVFPRREKHSLVQVRIHRTASRVTLRSEPPRLNRVCWAACFAYNSRAWVVRPIAIPRHFARRASATCSRGERVRAVLAARLERVRAVLAARLERVRAVLAARLERVRA